MRFFRWAWTSHEEQFTTCELFLGTVFFPLGLLATKKAGGFVLFGFSVLPLVLGTYLAIGGRWGFAAIAFFEVFAFVLLGCHSIQGFRSAENGDEEKESALSRTVEFGSVVLELLASLLVFPFKLVALEARRLPGAKRIGGFLGVAREYLRSAKQRVCLIVRLT